MNFLTEMLSQTFRHVATVSFVRAKLQLDVYFADVACNMIYMLQREFFEYSNRPTLAFRSVALAALYFYYCISHWPSRAQGANLLTYSLRF